MGVPINLFAGITRTGFPRFSFSGRYELIDEGAADDGTKNWAIKFLSSGQLQFHSGVAAIDRLLVGGGAGGTNGTDTDAGSGGGGGQTSILNTQPVNFGETIEIIIGNGGSAGSDGEATSIVGLADGNAAGGAINGGGSGEMTTTGAELQVTGHGSHFESRVTYRVVREAGAWFAYCSKVEVRMLYEGYYAVQSFGYIDINGVQTVSINEIYPTNITNAQFGTVWGGKGVAVPVTMADGMVSFVSRYRKGTYGNTNDIWFYTNSGGTVRQNGMTDAGTTRTIAATKAKGQAGADGTDFSGTKYGAGGGGGMLGTGTGYSGGETGGGKGGNASTDGQAAAAGTGSGGGGGGPSRNGGRGSDGVVVIRNTR